MGLKPGLIAALLVVAGGTFAQGQTIIANLNLDHHPPAEISRWTSGEVSAVLSLYTDTSVAVKLHVTISRSGTEIATIDTSVRLHQGVNIYTGRDLARSNEKDFSASDATRTGRLPSGKYEFCVSILDMSNVPLPVTGSTCSSFTLSGVEPPHLDFPGDGENFSPDQLRFFQWLPSSSVGEKVSYRFRLVRIYPGQTPTNAFQGNRALYEEEAVSPTLLSLPNSLSPLEPGLYVWSVQGIEPNGSYLGNSDGWAALSVFTILDREGTKFERTLLGNDDPSGLDADDAEFDTVTFERIEPEVAGAFPEHPGTSDSDIIPLGKSTGDSLDPQSQKGADSALNKPQIVGEQSARQFLFENTTLKGQRAFTQGPEIVRYQNIIFHDTLLESTEPIYAQFFEDTISITIAEKKGLKYGTRWVGAIANDQESHVLFVRRGDVIIGNIVKGGILYQVRYFGGGVHKLMQIDQSNFTGEGEPVVPDDEESYQDFPDTDPPDRIDVAVLYTKNARDGAGGGLAIEAEILLAVEETNLTYAVSGIGHRFELVQIIGASYSESGDLNIDLTWLENNGRVAALRDEASADIVMLVVEKGNFNGLANIMKYPDHSAERHAFGVVQRSAATGNYTFGHETGHILGCHHDCQTDEAGPPMYSFAHGYRDTVWKKGTIMADYRPGYKRMPSFSNPNLRSGGGVGTMEGECASCEACLMEKTASIVANFRRGPEGGEDVWMKDTWNDVGAEPNRPDSTRYLWSAPWIEVLRDTGVSLDLQHRIPLRGQPRWIAVTIRNGGRDSALGLLQLYYREASLSTLWDSSWTLLSETPGHLPPGIAQTLKIPWRDVPGNGDYSIVAKWVSASDSMHTPESEDLAYNALQNNNIVWKNEHVLNMIPSTSTRADVTFPGVENSTIEVICSPSTLSKCTFKEAGFIRVRFDDETSKLLLEKGGIEGMERTKEGEWKMTADKGGTFHIPVGAGGRSGRMSIFFESKASSSAAQYPVHILQKSADSTVAEEAIIGGVSYLLVYAGDEGNRWEKPDTTMRSAVAAAVAGRMQIERLERTKKEKLIFLTGSASVMGQGYWSSNSIGPEPAPLFGRIILAPTLHFSDQFSLPLRLAFFMPNALETGRSNSSFARMLINPANNFGLSPTFGGVKINIGSHTPELSGLVGSSVQLFGLGVDLRAGDFSVLLSGGWSQPEVKPDTANGRPGRYARIMGVGKIALEREEMKVGLNLLYISDDKGSAKDLTVRRTLRTFLGKENIRTIEWSDTLEAGDTIPRLGEILIVVDADTLILVRSDMAERDTLYREREEDREETLPNSLLAPPQRNIVATLAGAFPINEAVSIEGEIGGSIFTKDLNADSLDRNSSILHNGFISAANDLLQLRTSTQMDVAATLKVNVNKGIHRKKKIWDLTADLKYIGAGYRSLALPYLEGDRLLMSVAPDLELMGGKIFLSGKFEWKKNNLTGQEAATNMEATASTDVSWQVSGPFRLDAGYRRTEQYGSGQGSEIESGVNSSSSSGVHCTPSYRISSGSMTHVLSLPLSFTHTRSFLSSTCTTAIGNYSLGFSTIPLTADACLVFTHNTLALGERVIPGSSQSGRAGIGYEFLQSRLPCRLFVALERFIPMEWDGEGTVERRTTVGGSVDWRVTDVVGLSARIETTSSTLNSLSDTWRIRGETALRLLW